MKNKRLSVIALFLCILLLFPLLPVRAQEQESNPTSETSISAPAETSTEEAPAPAEETSSEENLPSLSEATPVSSAWEQNDFLYSADFQTIIGFSDAGNAKLANNKNVVLPDSVKNAEGTDTPIIRIGENAFQQKAIEGITLSANLQFVEKFAFEGNAIAGEVLLPDSLTFIGYNAFQNNKITKITLPDNIGMLSPYAFDNNEIAELDFGKAASLRGNRWSREDSLRNGFHGMLSYGTFSNNKLTRITIPNTLWGIGVSAFENNDLRSLVIPHAMRNIYYDAFENNKNLSDLVFETDDAGNGVLQIDGGAFSGCALQKLVFPKNFNEMGGYSFANNQISEVIFTGGNLKTMIFGYYSLSGNPFTEIVLPATKWGHFEYGAVSNNTNLKNVSFENFRLDFDNNHDKTRNNYIPEDAFRNCNLKALEIPDFVVEFRSNVFKNNPGWHENTKQVALYRTKEDGSYELNNKLSDGENYTFNPVLLSLDFKDQSGNPVAVTNRTLKRTRTLADGTEETKEVTALTDFKLGDRVSITVETPAGYQFTSATAGKSNAEITGNTISFTLMPSTPVLENKSYGDGYKVGYFQTPVALLFNKTNSDPLLPYVPTPSEEPSAPVPPKTEEVTETIVPKDAPSIPKTTPDADETTKITNEPVNEPIESQEAIEDEIITQGATELPKTDGISFFGFALLGLLLSSTGLFLKRK